MYLVINIAISSYIISVFLSSDLSSMIGLGAYFICENVYLFIIYLVYYFGCKKFKVNYILVG